MMNLMVIAAAGLAGMAGAALPAAADHATGRASLDYVVSWVVLNDRTLDVDGGASQWYQIDLAAPFASLASVAEMALVPGPDNGIEAASTLLTGEQDCAILDISAIAAPSLPMVDASVQAEGADPR